MLLEPNSSVDEQNAHSGQILNLAMFRVFRNPLPCLEHLEMLQITRMYFEK